jgi:hypothetical protein
MLTMITEIAVKNVGVPKVFDTPNLPRLAKLTTTYDRPCRGEVSLTASLTDRPPSPPFVAWKTNGRDNG